MAIPSPATMPPPSWSPTRRCRRRWPSTTGASSPITVRFAQPAPLAAARMPRMNDVAPTAFLRTDPQGFVSAPGAAVNGSWLADEALVVGRLLELARLPPPARAAVHQDE